MKGKSKKFNYFKVFELLNKQLNGTDTEKLLTFIDSSSKWIIIISDILIMSVIDF